MSLSIFVRCVFYLLGSGLNILFCSLYRELNKNNQLFESHNTSIGDDLLRPFVEFKNLAESKGHSVSTVGTKIAAALADAIVFIDMPRQSCEVYTYALDSGIPIYLIALESKAIHPSSFDVSCHAAFKKVFTWSDELVELDDKRYLKINYSHNIPTSITKRYADKKLLTMIAGNKRVSHKGELYSVRAKLVKWYEDNHPDSFDLYGMFWDRYPQTDSRIMNVLINRFGFIGQLMKTNYTSYRGQVERKKPVLERYRFSICFENVEGVPGFITEKIFDCFFAGNVPVYLGASNVEMYIPPNCFVDMRKFTSLADLHLYLSEMSEGEYMRYLNSIEEFLRSSADQFSIGTFAKNLLNNIV